MGQRRAGRENGALQPPRRQGRLGQVRDLFNLFDTAQKGRLFSDIAAAMGGVPGELVERQLAHFKLVHPEYEAGVRISLNNAHGHDADKIGAAAE